MAKKKLPRQQKTLGDFACMRLTLPPEQCTLESPPADLSRLDDLMTEFCVNQDHRADVREAMLDAFTPTKTELDWLVDAMALATVRRTAELLPPLVPGSAVWQCLRPADPALLAYRRAMVEEIERFGGGQDFLDGEHAFWRDALTRFGAETGRDLSQAPTAIVDAFAARTVKHAQHAGALKFDVEQVFDARTFADLKAIPLEGDESEYIAAMDAAARLAVRELLAGESH